MGEIQMCDPQVMQGMFYLDVLYLLKLWPKKDMVRNKRLQNDDDDATLHWQEHASTQLLTLMADYLWHNLRGQNPQPPIDEVE